MSRSGNLKETGSVFLGLSIMLGMVAIGIGLLTGVATFSIWVLKWTFPAFFITFLISVVILAPLSLIGPTRGFASLGLLIASFVFGAILWLWGMGYTYSVWGIIGVILGLVFFGVGVVPVAMFAALVHGDWGNLVAFIVTAAITFGLRAFSFWLGRKADERDARLRQPIINVRAYQVEHGAADTAR